MIEDAATIPDGARLEADLAIVGAGAAGITLARELRDTPLRILLLEAGGETATPESQAVYRGTSVGHAYYPLDSSRLRFFGGTTNHWGGMSIPFDPIDFRDRPWVPHSGWPLDYAALEPYLARAHAVCEIGPVEYSEDYWAPRRGKEPCPIRGPELIPRVAQFSPPTRFGRRYREDLEAAPRIRTLLGANVVGIESDAEGTRVEGLRLATFGGQRFAVKARAVVLATGAIENARLLLASRDARPEGLGNAHDGVGRYFMERVNRRSGVLLPVDPSRIAPFFRQDRLGDMGVNGYLGTAPGWQQRERVLNSSIHLHPAGSLELRETEGGVASLRRLTSALRRGQLPDDLGHDLWQVLRDLDEVAAHGWSRLRGDEKGEAPRTFEIWHDVEPAPNPQSRVTLGDDVDAFGMPRVVLDWQLTPDLEGATIRKALDLLAHEVGRLGLGRVKAEIAPEGNDWVPEVVGSFHQMGTTRMSADPRHGVVDADCQVHGVRNLYVAGSSVFTTAGQANPTLCLLALTIRLADHLRTGLRA